MKALALILPTIVLCAACAGFPAVAAVGRHQPCVGPPMASPASYDRAETGPESTLIEKLLL
ncbi:MAG TPA: hypothetical protein PLN33_17585 [Hyphomonadaceae bacterium]|nr:hypothetical protein [Hyphomonadaceae bacterium]HPN06760.1 hypothetical protein [Hyphomonadaceae bacterium]